MKGFIKITKDNGSIVRIQVARIDYCIQETEKIDICVNGRVISLHGTDEMSQFLANFKE